MDDPPGRHECGIDLLSGFGLWSLAWGHLVSFDRMTAIFSGRRRRSIDDATVRDRRATEDDRDGLGRVRSRNASGLVLPVGTLDPWAGLPSGRVINSYLDDGPPRQGKSPEAAPVHRCGVGWRVRPHCRLEAHVSRLDERDVLRALRGGTLQPGYQRDEEWRYEVVTRTLTVVVCFVSYTEVHAVTVWRNH